MPRSEESNVGSQPASTSLVTEHTQQAKDPQWWVIEGSSKDSKTCHRRISFNLLPSLQCSSASSQEFQSYRTSPVLIPFLSYPSPNFKMPMWGWRSETWLASWGRKGRNITLRIVGTPYIQTPLLCPLHHFQPSICIRLKFYLWAGSYFSSLH